MAGLAACASLVDDHQECSRDSDCPGGQDYSLTVASGFAKAATLNVQADTDADEVGIVHRNTYAINGRSSMGPEDLISPGACLSWRSGDLFIDSWILRCQ